MSAPQFFLRDTKMERQSDGLRRYEAEMKRGWNEPFYSPIICRENIVIVQYSPFIYAENIVMMRSSPFIYRENILMVKYSPSSCRENI